MFKFGIIGMNEGNGHPYSYSAVFNGYDEEALAKCPFEIIRKYLRHHHRNQIFIDNARVTHIWTQNRELSESVAATARIPNIAASIDELAEQVDAIIFARDDMWNHWEMAGRLFKTGKPVYMDKLLAHDRNDLEKFISVAGAEYPLMTASSFRFSPEVDNAAESVDLTAVRAVHGMSPCVWVRYAPHLLDPLFRLFGRNVATVQNCGRDRADVVCLTYKNGLQAILQVIEGVGLPIGLTCHYGTGTAPRSILYTDPTLESYFYSIVNMMKAFTAMVATGRRTECFADTVFLNRIVLSGIFSREQGGRLIELENFMENV